MVPFAASLEWYAIWWKARRERLSDSEAVSAANVATGIGGKDFARCRISANGNEILLSMAIEGGASTLKRQSQISKARLSDHGNWRHVHLGALEAAYGRAPYYQHLIPLIKGVYDSSENSLQGFNDALHKALCQFLNITGHHEDLDLITASGSDVSLERAKELLSLASSRLSMIDALMNFGHETLLVLNAF